MSATEHTATKFRRSWLLLATLSVVLIASCTFGIAASVAADESNLAKETVIYKQVGPTEIHADVYRRNGEIVRPAVVYIHGGALILGNRTDVPKNLLELCRKENFVLVSIDYRLGPEVKLPEIIQDVQDAFRWIRTAGAKQCFIDPTKIAVAGGSAGGYLTMMTGICIEPRPVALVAYYGYGDVDGPWYAEPSPHYRQQPLVSRDEAYGLVGRGVTTGANSQARGKYYLYLRQNGLWTKEITGFDPATERAKLDPYCPVRNITPEYPPIVMIHGTADDDVPYQQSVDMAAALKAKGVTHELITVEGGGHGLGGGDRQVIVDAQNRALAFLRERLN